MTDVSINLAPTTTTTPRRRKIDCFPASWLASKLHAHDEPYLFPLRKSGLGSNSSGATCSPLFPVVSFPALPTKQTHQQHPYERPYDDLPTTFISVNDVVDGLGHLHWLPSIVPALCAHHRIDGQALIALNSKDLRRFFYLEDGALQQRFLSYVALCDLLSSFEEE